MTPQAIAYQKQWTKKHQRIRKHNFWVNFIRPILGFNLKNNKYCILPEYKGIR